jgi:hypothetical protein
VSGLTGLEERVALLAARNGLDADPDEYTPAVMAYEFTHQMLWENGEIKWEDLPDQPTVEWTVRYVQHVKRLSEERQG